MVQLLQPHFATHPKSFFGSESFPNISSQAFLALGSGGNFATVFLTVPPLLVGPSTVERFGSPAPLSRENSADNLSDSKFVRAICASACRRHSSNSISCFASSGLVGLSIGGASNVFIFVKSSIPNFA